MILVCQAAKLSSPPGGARHLHLSFTVARRRGLIVSSLNCSEGKGLNPKPRIEKCMAYLEAELQFRSYRVFSAANCEP